MFATGAMNVLWMAALGITMTLEKMLTGRRLSAAIGAIMVTAGLFMMGAAVAAHWLPPAD
jgi:predicted metal-binding membrane protein